MPVFGIDVSQWRGAISWPTVAASGLATFASTRIIDGEVPDSRWQANAQGARDHIALPIVHARVKPGDQAGRAARFLDMTDSIHDLATVGLMVDIEDQGVTVADGMAFCRAVHQLAGRWPLAYVPAWWLAGKPPWTLPETPWWPSRYVPQPWTPQALEAIRPPLHPGFTTMGPWQFTSSGEVPGVPPPADRNVFFGTELELGHLLRGETMSALWFPGTDRSRPARVDGGSILGGPPKCLWHDTETNAVPSYSTDSWPNMTLDPRTGHTWQHIGADRAGRALRNPAGGVQTNRWNVFQIEIIGWVNKIPFHPVMREVAQWLHEVRGTPLRATVDWLPYDASFGNTRVRLSGAAWSTYSGHLGHMHAPENAHGDPGWPFPIAQIIAAEEADMPLTDAEWKRLETLLDKYTREGARWTDHGDNEVAGAGNHLVRVREDLRLFAEATGKRLDALEELLTPEPPAATTTPTGES